MITLNNVTKTYSLSKPGEYTAVHDVTVELPARQITVFKGPSGSGKTSLLTLIGCMVRPTSGRIHLHGMAEQFPFQKDESAPLEITGLPERFLTTIRRTTFGFIFQQCNLITGISVLENVMLPAYTTGERLSKVRERALLLLEQFAVVRHAHRRVDLLSGGEAQRVAIARALINNPTILIADEPTAHLDSKLSHEFMEIVFRLKQEGKTVLIASHDPIVTDSVQRDRVVELRDGVICEQGSNR